MIKLTAIGHLGKDAIINQANGKQVINFSVAHTEKFTSNGQSQEKTTWIECAYWSDSKVGPYLKKGVQVYIEGTPEVRTYPKNDGTTGTSLSVRVFQVQLLSGGGQQQVPASQGTAARPATATIINEDPNDLPF